MRCPTCNAPYADDTGVMCPACMLEEGLGLIEDTDPFGESFFDDVELHDEDPSDSMRSTKVLEAVAEKTGAIAESMLDSRGDGYDVGGLLARGGMGSIHKAYDKNCGRTVAMKLLHSNKERDANSVQRFINEAQITAQLEHPNIVPVHDVGLTKGDRVYYTMKHVQGRDLGSIIDAIQDGDERMIERFPLSRMLEIFLKVCDAIAFAHARDIVHRDLKPDNIMVAGFGEVLVLDWGLAKVIGHEDDHEHVEELRDSLTPSGGRAAKYVAGTAVGQILGTVAYMSPEQAKGANSEVDARSDIYALGGILYCILTLAPPISPGSMDEMIEAVLTNQIIDPQQRARESEENPFAPRGRLPSSLCAVAMKAMAHSPLFRYQSVPELQHDIHAYLSGFATEAEEASPLQELRLYVNRKWALFSVLAVAALLIFSMAVASILSLQIQQEKLKDAYDQATKSLSNSHDLRVKLTESERSRRSLRELKAIESLREAEALIKAKDFPAANARATDVTQNVPDLANGWYTRARIDIANGELDQATRHLKHALKLEPDSEMPLLSYHSGAVKAQSSDEPAALADLSIRLAAQGDADVLAQFLQQPHPQKRARTILRVMTSNADFDPQAVVDSMRPDGLHVLLRGSPKPLGELSVARVVIETNALDYASLRHLDCLELNLRRVPEGDLQLLTGLGLEVLHLPPMTVDARHLAGLGLQELHLYGGDLIRVGALRSPRLQLHLHGPATQLVPLLDSARLAGLHLHHLPADKVESTLRALPPNLAILGFHNCPIDNIDFLATRPLKRLFLRNSQVHDLAPLRGKSLELLDLEGSPVSDLNSLIGMPLYTLRLSGTLVSNFRAIRGLPLRELTLAGLRNVDRAPLAGHELHVLDASHSDLRTLTPLLDMPLETLYLHGCPLIQLSPLSEISSLRELSIPGRPSPALLTLPHLLRIGSGKQLQPVVAAELHAALQRANPSYDTTGILTVRHGVVVGADLTDAKLVDISPLADLPLHTLNLSNNPVLEDLSALANAPLVDLDLSGTAVTQLPFVKSAPLRRLHLARCSALTTLDLRSSQLEELVIDESPLSTIRLPKTLKKLSAVGVQQAADPELLGSLLLTNLTLTGTGLSSLEPLKQMQRQLEVLRIGSNPISNPSLLSELRNLRVLDITGLHAQPDYIPLKSLQELWVQHSLIQSWARKDPHNDRIRQLQRLHRDRPWGRFERFGHAFELLAGEMTLDEAHAACEARNGRLLTIENVAEFAFFHQYVLSGEPVWLDLTNESGTDWVDSQGTVAGYLEWEPGAPSTEPERSQIVLGLNGSARMVNRAPEERYGVICQWRQ